MKHLLYSLFLFSFFQAQAQTRQSDSLIVWNWYQGLEDQGSLYWDPNDAVCDWEGIRCNENGRIDALILIAKKLKGSLVKLNELSELEYLSFKYNNFSGNLPNFELPKLKELNLWGNQFSGNVPNFEKTPNLKWLGLNNNQLSGSLPNFDKLPNLEELFLSSNQLSGSLPNFEHTPKLKTLEVENNQFSQPLPALKHLAALKNYKH